MAKQCTHCGYELPKDDAPFCSRCGMPQDSVPLHPQHPQEKPHQMSGLPSLANPGEKPSLREQVAEQPASRFPSGVPEQSPHANISRREASSPSLFDYPALPPILKSQPGAEPDERVPGGQMHISTSRNDELQESPGSGAMSGRSSAAFPGEEQLTAIEDMPTNMMPLAPISESGLIQKEVAEHSELTSVGEFERMAIEDMPTRNMPLTPAQRNVLSDIPGQMTKPPITRIDEIASVDTRMLPAETKMDTPPVQGISPVQPADAQPSATRRTPAAQRRTIFISVAALIIVVLFGGGLWAFLAGVFSVSPVTQPWQLYSDSRMGVALNYPAGWPKGSYDKAGTLTLHDSSNTAMLTLSKASASGVDPTHMLQQQASKLSLTNVKALDALSFAGVKWQREQGSIQKNGATYTIVLFVGAHGNSLYTLGMLAAQSVYSEYERTVFAPMRASLRFL